MSSKSAEARVRAPRSVGSITRRFTLLYVGSTGILLLLAVGFLYWTLKKNLDMRDRALVVSKARVLRLLLRETPEEQAVLASEIQHEAAEGPLRYYLRVLDASGHVLLETPGMSDRLPPDTFPPAGAILPEPAWRNVPNVRLHEAFILLAALAQTGGAHPASRQIQVALDISAELALLSNYRHKLVLVLLATLVSVRASHTSCVSGFWQYTCFPASIAALAMAAWV